MTTPEDLSWEIIIVDNNSQDNTRDVVEDFRINSGLNVVYAFEGKQGLSYARNSGIKEAKGEIIVFTDDDVIVDKHWLVNMIGAFEETDAVCVGGKILPIWEKSPPKWLKKELYGYLALQDLGDKHVRMAEPEIWGANFAVKSSVFQKYGYFNTAIGRTPAKLYGGEDTEFIEKLIKGQERVYYSPDMLVHHCIPKERMEKTYFRKWKYNAGELRGIQMGGQLLCRNIKGIPLFAIKCIVEGFIKYLFFLATQPQKAFREQLRFIYYTGFITGRIRYRNIQQ